ncbi:MAG: Holliday junction resolvase RuvX [Bacteroidales bacterium]|nr:Holliday junction resolvase RuvX [Bacteroidales bacterium]
MGRIMAIDYGRVRTGLAVTDPVRIIATALTTVETPTLLHYIKDYCAREEVDIFVVGDARHLDGTPSESMQLIEPFVAKLHETFPDKEIARVDERFTSKMAFQTMIDSGLKKKDRRNKGMIDQIAATIMLQTYMNTINNRPI